MNLTEVMKKVFGEIKEVSIEENKTKRDQAKNVKPGMQKLLKRQIIVLPKILMLVSKRIIVETQIVLLIVFGVILLIKTLDGNIAVQSTHL